MHEKLRINNQVGVRLSRQHRDQNEIRIEHVRPGEDEDDTANDIEPVMEARGELKALQPDLPPK